MAKEYVELNEMADNLYENYLPGPITVISVSKGNLYHLLCLYKELWVLGTLTMILL